MREASPGGLRLETGLGSGRTWWEWVTVATQPRFCGGEVAGGGGGGVGDAVALERGRIAKATEGLSGDLGRWARCVPNGGRWWLCVC